MRRSEAPACIALCANTGAGLAVVTILSDMIGFRIAFNLRDEVSPTSLTFFRTFSLLTLTARMCWRRPPLTRAAPQAKVHRAFAAVASMRLLETDDKAAELRQRQPQWHLPPQHAAFGRRARRAADSLAGHYQREFRILRLRLREKMQKRRMRLFLRQAMKIEPDVDRRVAARDALPQAAIELRQRRWLFCMCAFFGQALC